MSTSQSSGQARDIRDIVGTPVTTVIKNPRILRDILRELLEGLLGSPGFALNSQTDFSQQQISGLLCVVPTAPETTSSRSTFSNSIERRLCWDLSLVNFGESEQDAANFDQAIERIERKFPGTYGRRLPRREDAYQSVDFKIVQTALTSLI